MGLYKAITRNRTVPGSLTRNELGAVERSIGYLQGGYKDTTIHSSVQLFNTTTQVGTIVYDTGYQRSYVPGISGNLCGYFSVTDAIAYNKFAFITASASTSFSTANYPGVSVSDLEYKSSWLLCSNPSVAHPQAAIVEWMQIDLATDTPISRGNPSNAPIATTRQALGTKTAGFFANAVALNMTALDFTTQSVFTTPASSTFSAIQFTSGLSVSDSVGYFIGFIAGNVKMSMTGTTVNSYANLSSYTYPFGESHSLTSSTDGYMMAGYNDTTGRYGLTQHGLCQKMSLTTEAVTTLPDLVLPQSSGQMMTGF